MQLRKKWPKKNNFSFVSRLNGKLFFFCFLTFIFKMHIFFKFIIWNRITDADAVHVYEQRNLWEIELPFKNVS